MHIKSVSLYLPRNEWNTGSRKFHPRKPGHGRGSAPYGHWLDQPPVGNVQTGQFKTTRLRAARSLVTLFLFKRNSLSNVAGTPRTARWTLALRSAEANYTRIKDGVNAATLQNFASNSLRHSFPRDVTQQFQVSTREQPKKHEPTTWQT